MANKKIWIASLEGTFREIEITEDEIPRALWNYKFGLPGTYEGGSGIIRAITPDHVQSMGWNKGHKPIPDDWNDIRKELGRSLEDTVSNIKLLMVNCKSLPELETKIKIELLPSGKIKGQETKQISAGYTGIGNY